MLWYLRSFADVILGAMAKFVALIFAASAILMVACTDGGVESGDGWMLSSVEVVQSAERPEVQTNVSDGGVGVSISVESGSGGSAECGLPVIESFGRAGGNSSLMMRHRWPRRGCVDVGFAVFHLVISDVAEEGTIVSFQPEPEGVCERARVFPDGVVEQMEPIGC